MGLLLLLALTRTVSAPENEVTEWNWQQFWIVWSFLYIQSHIVALNLYIYVYQPLPQRLFFTRVLSVFTELADSVYKSWCPWNVMCYCCAIARKFFRGIFFLLPGYCGFEPPDPFWPILTGFDMIFQVLKYFFSVFSKFHIIPRIIKKKKNLHPRTPWNHY